MVSFGSRVSSRMLLKNILSFITIGAAFKMVQNQPFDDGESMEISSKHLKQVVEQSNQILSFSESVIPEDTLQYHYALGDESQKNDTEIDEKHSSAVFLELHGSDFDTSFPGCISFSSGANNSKAPEEGSPSKSPRHYSISSDFFNPVNHQRRILTYCEEIYSLLLDHPPQKSVSIGPDHQAIVPPWRSRDVEVMSYVSGSDSKSDLTGAEYEKRLIGTCVIPMPDEDSPISCSQEFGSGRAACSCEDGGSVGCVNMHIAEAREQLKSSIGQERFVELGFFEMGEQVAQKWSEEEERLFYEVVFSNPVSVGKNFWGDLSVVFASKSKREIVSYYFNVFMLRRRAEQNRCDSLNIDSDNDEWQGTDDYGDNEPGMTEEDDDSVVESPLHDVGSGFNRGREDDLQEYDEDIADERFDDDESGGIGNCFNNCGSTPTLPNKIPCDERGEHEVQDDSCTSSDTCPTTQALPAKTEHCDQWLGSFTGPNNSAGLGHEPSTVQEHCDAKVWDVGYLTCSKSEVDFLPTSSMIEEVFGDDSSHYKAMDGKNLS
ncbi:AT-rich interactive domain-containing protein 2, partial [Cucurbita argyrosperma subsp. argyrosperma]